MLQEVLDSLPDDCKTIMDGTLGHGGHSREILNIYSSINKHIWVDRDLAMLAKAKIRLKENEEKVVYVQWSYAELEKIVQQAKIDAFDFILLDIWVNMDHFKVADRGFSIKLDWELDMRYDRNTGVSAGDRLSKTKYNEMFDVFTLYTDFTPKFIWLFVDDLLHYKKRIPLISTSDLVTWAKQLWINDKKLAVIFQAIRIHVNNELWELDLFLKKFQNFVKVGGRCGIMTYHSIEDRMVKIVFKSLLDTGNFVLHNKKVIKPHWLEIKKNKAARSAKYRVIERIR